MKESTESSTINESTHLKNLLMKLYQHGEIDAQEYHQLHLIVDSFQELMPIFHEPEMNWETG